MSEVINIKELNERIERESVFVDTLRTEMGKVIVGQSHLVDTLLIGLLSNGHILLEGVPGLAKTLAITTLIIGWGLVIAAALILYGVAFIWMESRKKQPKIGSFQEMSYKSAFGIGVFQMLALIPGTSRSGSTILGATLLGTSRTVAAEFSFFMAIPVMLGASGVKFLKALVIDKVSFSGQEWAALIIATVVSFLVSLVVIRFLMNFIKKHDFKPFGWYRIALGALVILLVLLNVIPNVVHA